MNHSERSTANSTVNRSKTLCNQSIKGKNTGKNLYLSVASSFLADKLSSNHFDSRTRVPYLPSDRYIPFLNLIWMDSTSVSESLLFLACFLSHVPGRWSVPYLSYSSSIYERYSTLSIDPGRRHHPSFTAWSDRGKTLRDSYSVIDSEIASIPYTPV